MIDDIEELGVNDPREQNLEIYINLRLRMVNKEKYNMGGFCTN